MEGTETETTPEVAPELGSVRSYILAEQEERRESTVERITIPRLPRVVLRCHTMHDRDLLAASIEREENPNKVEGLIQGAIIALLTSCDGVETDKGDDLGVQLGVQLSQYLGPDAKCGTARTDEEAVLEVFGSEADLVKSAGELETLSTAANEQIEVQIVGNSDAAS
jgi:hypothetical protein